MSREQMINSLISDDIETIRVWLELGKYDVLREWLKNSLYYEQVPDEVLQQEYEKRNSL